MGMPVLKNVCRQPSREPLMAFKGFDNPQRDLIGAWLLSPHEFVWCDTRVHFETRNPSLTVQRRKGFLIASYKLPRREARLSSCLDPGVFRLASIHNPGYFPMPRPASA